MERTEHAGEPIIAFADQAAWEGWLERNHDGATGVWLKLARKGAGAVTVTHAEALEIALCFGWIDARRDRFDDVHFLHRFTPRTKRSRWSQVNRGAAERLIAAGRMRPAGLARVQEARADGRWDAAYEPQGSASVPPDLQAALDAAPDAKAFFETLTGNRRYAFLYRLTTAKKPETRARRVDQFVQMMRERRTFHDT